MPRFVPRSVAIELVRGCNFSCPMCPVTSNAHLEPSRYQYMAPELLSALVDEIERCPSISSIWFFHMGESMLHPQYRRCLEILHRSAVVRAARVLQHTNASVLSGDKAEAILDIPVIDKLVFSFDGFGDKESFERLRGPHFDRVVANIKAFAEQARRRRPELQLATCTILPRDGEVPGLRMATKDTALVQLTALFEPLGVAVETRDMHDYTGNENLLMHGHKPPRVLGGCPFVERDALHFTVNGWAQPCCTYSEQFNIGHVGTQNFEQLLNNEAMGALRHSLRLDQREDLPFCRNCTVSMSKGMSAVGIERVWNGRYQQGLLTDDCERDYLFNTVIPLVKASGR
jgi:sulfatase maturation enzyme AslB (radical SAM superfamily)